MPVFIVQDDIVNRKVDAIVNAANSELAEGGGVCGAIFRSAGARQMQRACDAIGHCDTGGAVITPGFNLPARYVIHAVGPEWEGGGCKERGLLLSAYRSSLELASSNGCSSIAFPLLSSGIFGVPPEISAQAANTAFSAFLEGHEMDIELVLYSRGSQVISDKTFSSIRDYVESSFEAQSQLLGSELLDGAEIPMPASMAPKMDSEPVFSRRHGRLAAAGAKLSSLAGTEPNARGRDLEHLVDNAGETFSEMLLRLIDEKGASDPVIYHKANMSRKLFSKIRSDAHYQPSKRTVLALAIALELSLDETVDLLGAAGMALSPASAGDLIVRYYIENGIYDILEINEALFTFDQPLLCG